MSKPKAKKKCQPERSPTITEADLATVKVARDLREKLQVIYKTPCAHCGAKVTIPRLAAAIGIDAAVLWRFMHGKQETLMEDNFKKLQEWVQGRVEAGR